MALKRHLCAANSEIGPYKLVAQGARRIAGIIMSLGGLRHRGGAWKSARRWWREMAV